MIKVGAWGVPVVAAAIAVPAASASNEIPGLDLVNTVNADADYRGLGSVNSLGGSEGNIQQATSYNSSGWAASQYTHSSGFRYRFRVASIGEGPLKGPISIAFDIPYAGSFQYNSSQGPGNSSNYPVVSFNSGLFKIQGNGGIAFGSSARGTGRDATVYGAGPTWTYTAGEVRTTSLPNGSNRTSTSTNGEVTLTQTVTSVQRVTLSTTLATPLAPGDWVSVDTFWLIPDSLRFPNGGNQNYSDDVNNTWIQPTGLRSFTWHSVVTASTTETGPAALPATDTLDGQQSARPDGLYYFDGGPPLQFGQG